jgi:HSP20 family molecular chaperone IbpA
MFHKNKGDLVSEDNNIWFSKKKKEYPNKEDWTFPDIESAFRAMQRDMKDRQKEITKANQHVPTYFGSLKNKKPSCKRHFIQGYKITTGPDGKTKITRFGSQTPKRLHPNIQSFKKSTKELEPLLDIMQIDKEVMVVMELPGANKKDIKVTLSDKKLIISAKKSDTLICKKIELPIKIDKNNSEATYKNGVLTIKLPKIK